MSMDGFINKLFRLVFYFISTARFAYTERYLYHLDSIENDGKLTYVSLHFRGKRIGCKIPCHTICEEKFINEIHPIDACIIGALSESIDAKVVEYFKKIYKNFRQKSLTTVKVKKILIVKKIHSLAKMEEKFFLSSYDENSCKAHEISLHELASNPYLLTGIGAKSAFQIGQEITRKLLYANDFKY